MLRATGETENEDLQQETRRVNERRRDRRAMRVSWLQRRRENPCILPPVCSGGQRSRVIRLWSSDPSKDKWSLRAM